MQWGAGGGTDAGCTWVISWADHGWEAAVLTPSILLPRSLIQAFIMSQARPQQTCTVFRKRERERKKSKRGERTRVGKETCSRRWDILRRPKELCSLSGMTVWSPLLYISQPKCYCFDPGYRTNCVRLNLVHQGLLVRGKKMARSHCHNCLKVRWWQLSPPPHSPACTLNQGWDRHLVNPEFWAPLCSASVATLPD